MFKLFVGSRWRKDEAVKYECKGVFSSLPDAVFEFFDYKSSITSKFGCLYGDSEIHLVWGADLVFDDRLLLSAFNEKDVVSVRDDGLKNYLCYKLDHYIYPERYVDDYDGLDIGSATVDEMKRQNNS